MGERAGGSIDTGDDPALAIGDPAEGSGVSARHARGGAIADIHPIELADEVIAAVHCRVKRHVDVVGIVGGDVRNLQSDVESQRVMIFEQRDHALAIG